MARCAGNGRVRAGQRESRVVVIERRGRPVGRRVADGAIRRESCRDVIRHRTAKRGRALPIRCMAAVTSGRVQRVIVVDMASGAGRRRR